MDCAEIYLDPTKPFCVYAHSRNGVVLYVGSGIASRPFLRASRSELWREIIGDAPYTVRVLGWYSTARNAEKAELHLIGQLKPLANRRGNGWTQAPEAIEAGASKRRGQKRSDDVRATLSEKRRAAVARGVVTNKLRYRFRCNETGEVFTSIRVASGKLGTSRSGVSHCLDGSQKTAGGYSFVKL